MPRWLRYTLISVAAVAGIAAAVVAVVVNTVDLERYARLATEHVRRATGRELAVNGKLSVGVFPRLRIAADDVTFANAPWGSRKDMARIKRVEGELSLLALLRGRVEVARLELVQPDVLLETNAKGVGNWVFDTKRDRAPDTDAEGGGPGLGIWALGIDDGTLAYRVPGRETTTLALKRVRLKERSVTAIDDVTLEAQFRGQAFTIRGSLGTLAAFLDKATDWPVDLVFETDGARASLAGRIDWRAKPLAIDADAKLEVRDAAGIGRLAGTPLDLPPLGVDMRLASSGGERRADPLRIAVGKTSAQGRVVVKTDGPRPFLTAELESPELDLSHDAKRRAAPKGGRIFSDAPFPLDALRALDGQAAIAIERLVLPNRVPLEKVNVHASLKAGRLEAQPLSALAGGGTVNGSLVLDAGAGRSPALAVQLDARQVQLERIAKAMGHGGSLTGGNADAAISLRGPGDSMRRFMGGANGELRLAVGPARVTGVALDAGGDALTRVLDSVNPSRRTDPYTEVRCVAARLPVRDGIATSQRSMAFETSRIDVVVAGTINFRNETLDLAIRPTVKEGLGVGVANLAELVKVTGTLTDPAVGLDTIASAKAALSVGGAVLTGGLSLLGQRFLDSRENDPHPCRTALAGGVPATPQQSTPAARTAPQQDGVMGAIRRLFN
jgi:hypothetical protein